MSGGHFFSPWESPSNSRRIRYGCGLHLNVSDTEKVLILCTFSKKFYKNIRTQKSRYPEGLEQLNAARMSAAGDGSTEPNLDFSSPFRPGVICAP